MITLLMKRRRDQRRDVAHGIKPPSPTDKALDPNTPDSETEYKPLEWPVIRKVLGWMAPYRNGYILATIVGLSVNLLDMLGPMYIRHLVDHDVLGHVHFLLRGLLWLLRTLGLAHAAEFVSNRTALHPYGWAITLTILCWAATTATALTLQRFGIGYTSRIGHQVVFNLRRAVFAHLQRLSMSFYDRTKFGRILTRGTSDLDALVNPIVWGLNTLVCNFFMMTIAAGIMLLVDWRLALSVLWLGPVLFYMNRVYKRHIGRRWRIVREGFTRVTTNLVENINGMRVVTAYNRQRDNLAVFNQLQVANTTNNIQAATVNGIYQPLLSVVGFLGKVIILLFGCYLIITTSDRPDGTLGKLSVGTLMAVLLYWDWFMNPVLNFGNFHNELMMAMASAERVFALLEQQPDVMDTPNATPLPPAKGHLVFEHVSFYYKADKPVLHDICFEAKPGQTIALVGHTGCGKSTIMNLICRFYLPQQGLIRLDGHDLNTITGESLHRQMGIVAQANYLFSGTVLDNIRYAAPEATLEQVIAAAKDLGSHDILENLKDGYNTQVGERGTSMSLGQRQLICFTRAFLANPRILMLDEATSAVDTHTEMLIQQALERLVADRTTFIVAHRLSTVTQADLVMVLDHGTILERGTHHSLLALNGKYAELYKQFTREI